MDSNIPCINAILGDIIDRSQAHLREGLNVAQSHHPTPEGPTLNVAITLRRFGFPPALLTPSGRNPDRDGFIAAYKRLALDITHDYRQADLPTYR